MGRPATVIKEAGDKMSAIVNDATKEYLATTGYLPDVNTSYIFNTKKNIEVSTEVAPGDAITEFGFDEDDDWIWDELLERSGDTPSE